MRVGWEGREGEGGVTVCGLGSYVLTGSWSGNSLEVVFSVDNYICVLGRGGFLNSWGCVVEGVVFESLYLGDFEFLKGCSFIESFKTLLRKVFSLRLT